MGSSLSDAAHSYVHGSVWKLDQNRRPTVTRRSPRKRKYIIFGGPVVFVRRVGAAAFWRAPRSRPLGLASVRFLKHAGGYRAPLSGDKECLFLVSEKLFSYGLSKEPRYSVSRIAAAGPRQLAPSTRPWYRYRT